MRPDRGYMNIKIELYYLAVKEIMEKSDPKRKGRRINTTRLLALAKRITLGGDTLLKATKALGIQRSGNIHSYAFVSATRELRSKVTKSRSVGNPVGSYSHSFKVAVVNTALGGASVSSISRETGVAHVTISRWILQHKAGIWTLDNATGFRSI